MNITTGRALSCPPGMASNAVPTAVARRLFDMESRDVKTREVFLLPGKAILLDAYGLAPDDYFTVLRLSRGSFDPANGQGCPPCGADAYSKPGATLATKPMRLGGKEWRLDACLDSMIINVPGWYQFEASSFDMVDRVILEYVEMDVSQMNIPAEYYPAVQVCAEG